MNNTAKLQALIIAISLLSAGTAMANHEIWLHDAPIEDGVLIPCKAAIW